MATADWYLTLLCVLSFCSGGLAIQCYQCDSNEDVTCPSSDSFDTTINGVVDCNSFEAHTPGQFCMKVYQESPGWGGWQKTTRRCGSRTDFGVAWGCRWTWDYTGIFRETCYCEDRDGCNGANHMSFSLLSAVLTVFAVLNNAVRL
ncbi:UPAR/Ly6 domain-containing protein crok-like [Littorina saxatilis]|uniref:UPAR/Ly6 domain-containing protein qvr n=1 Tax=Littorina saxatilis TaxID=31220 RepID=A0AAN9BTU6_9CAEN